ncbi:CTP synthase [Pseudomonas sp. G.S.17]|uniref:CTP synthase C-terminal region-related (seleno)protein n=1 Tax=Pseudomonas sp. G.S.17 TaxID=3137451 RepID=UPI00311C921E
MERVSRTGETVRIALVGDYNASVPAHRAIPLALEMAASAASVQVEYSWVPTPQVQDGAGLAGFDGIWCVPASPYLDMNGALTAIRYARERPLPFLGTCGGFQHALIEYARNVLGWQDAEHAETAPESANAIITPLTCSLLEVVADIRLRPGSLIAQAYEQLDIAECYQCRYGLRAELHEELFSGALGVSGRDKNGEIRAIELQGHPFFVASLFQPERAALAGSLPPLVAAFLGACLECRRR